MQSGTSYHTSAMSISQNAGRSIGNAYTEGPTWWMISMKVSIVFPRMARRNDGKKKAGGFNL